MTTPDSSGLTEKQTNLPAGMPVAARLRQDDFGLYTKAFRRGDDDDA